MGGFDTGAKHLLVRQEIFDAMKGEKVEVPITYKGATGGKAVLESGKLVVVATDIGTTMWIAYPQVYPLWVEALVPGPLGDALGTQVWNLPIKLKTTHEFVESQAAKAVVGQTIY